MDYLERLVDARLAALLAEVPAVLLTGPRACGKTTTARRLARTVIQLDDPSVGPVFRTAPDVALRGLEPPVLLDEWQAAPEVVGAVKRAVDRDPAPGQFVLTGSAGTDLAGVTWPGTGRIIRLAMSALTERELAGRVAAPSFLDVVREAPESFAAASALDLGDYVNLALRGGFPEPALRLTDATRMDWLGSYLDECFSRDIPALRTVRDPARLRRLFEALAANTAGVVDEKTVHEAARLDRRTALAYEALFEAVGITEQVPSFAGNRLKRLIERPKRYVTDGGLVAAALALERSSILRDANMLGRLVDTFVLAQLRGELGRSSATRARLHHLRSEGGRHEIDLVADLGPRGVVGIEVKAAGAPTAHDVRHLRWFLTEMTDRPTAAVVLHTGARAYELDGGVLALPISCIWST